MNSITKLVEEKPWVGWVLFFTTMIVVFVLGLFAASIVERRTEALYTYRPATDISEWEPDSSKWGKYFPREYESYLKTKDMNFRSKYAGNVPIDSLAEDPRLVVLWAGYGFARDYSAPRGHHYAVTDVRNTLRTGAPMTPAEGPQPATCWTCKSPDVPRLMSTMGPAKFYASKWAALGPEVTHAVGCADCHDPKTMSLRISRPALIEAFSRKGKDISKATHQEMRSLVCAQCHVEYYFQPQTSYLVFPWDSGTTVDEIERYYDSLNFSDWTHAISKAPMLKAQHPDWEVFALGIHAQRGLSCADCHMPYQSEGGVKYTSHHIQSPLKDVSTTCQVCHRESKEELMRNVFERQDKNFAIRIEAEDALVKAHFAAKKAWESGANDDEMAPVLKLIRHAQWRLDFAIAGHGSSFHAPLEVARILSTAVAKAQEARVILARVLAAHGFNSDIEVPDISTKEKDAVLILNSVDIVQDGVILIKKLVFMLY